MNSERVFEITICNKDWIPESMDYKIHIYLHDLNINASDDNQLKVSYNYSYDANDRHGEYIHENVKLLEIDVDNAVKSMLTEMKEQAESND